MPKISSKDATYHSAQDLIYALHNPAPAIPLVKLGYGNKEVLRALVDVLRKSIPPAVPPRVPVKGYIQEKLKKVNQERAQIKSKSQSETVTNLEPLRVPIVEAYP